MIIPIDELNLPAKGAYKNEKKKDYFKNFFSVMWLTEKEMEEHIKVAEEISEVIETMYYLFYILQPFDTDIAKKSLQGDLRDIVYAHGYYDNTMEKYLEDVAEMIVLTTVSHSSEPYYFSHDRAKDIGANETLSILNYKEIAEKIDAGYKYKTWLTMEDERVRPTHEAVDWVTIPIKEKFHVGEHLLFMPHDFNMMDIAPEEIINCRCQLIYG